MHTYTTNDTVWITGASSGLGFYTAEAFRHAGFTTVSGARSFTDGARPDVRSWQMRLDVTDDTSVSAFVSRTLESTGGPDILVLCAGKVNGIVDGRNTTKEEIGLLMTKTEKIINTEEV